MGRVARKDILNLGVAERIELISDIRDSTAEVAGAIELTDARKARKTARGEREQRLALGRQRQGHS